MFENITKFLKKFGKNEKDNSKDAAKERLHLVLAQDRANISADFLELMKQEIIEVIKKYIDIDEEAIDVKMTNKVGEDGTVGVPSLYANIPIVTIKNEARKLEKKSEEEDDKNKEEVNESENESKEDKIANSEVELKENIDTKIINVEEIITEVKEKEELPIEDNNEIIENEKFNKINELNELNEVNKINEEEAKSFIDKKD